MAVLFPSIHFQQNAGVGQGYFSSVPPTNTATEVINTGRNPVSLVITSTLGIQIVVIQKGQSYIAKLENTQTIGLLANDGPICGTLNIAVDVDGHFFGFGPV